MDKYHWFHSRDELIEVGLSEAQWATFVSSPNMGMGVPCTIDSINCKPMPGLPDPVDRSKQFAGELDKKLGGCLDEIKEVIATLDGMGLPKGKTAAIRDLMQSLLRELQSNMPFVAQSFGEHVEDTVEKAKQEIHGYMLGVVTRAGLSALQGQSLPLALKAPPSETAQ